jgi:hypothetical protein
VSVPTRENGCNDFQQKVSRYGSAIHVELDRQHKVLPLDDRELLEQAKPVARDGKMRPDRVLLLR